jgi:dipeptide/tripeptide permease
MYFGMENFFSCISINLISKIFQSGISGKLKETYWKSTPKSHWLDYAEDQFGAKVVMETKTVVNILVLYIPLPVYWAVYTQQASRWVFQAARMDGDIGFYRIKPDQMIVFNSLLGILMIPVCDYVLYPLMAKIGLKSHLQKMTIGGVLAAISFIISGFVEIEIEENFISIFWLLPQYLMIALSENFLYIANINFGYTEAPASMKSVIQSFTFLTIAIGSLIVALISGTKIFESQSTELFFFAGILLLAQIVFAILAYRYKSVNDVSK